MRVIVSSLCIYRAKNYCLLSTQLVAAYQWCGAAALKLAEQKKRLLKTVAFRSAIGPKVDCRSGYRQMLDDDPATYQGPACAVQLPRVTKRRRQ